ncbi:MAG: HNH endonuclease [Melioribacteraceae bacterium]|nr:MAG: HNH endonuclease [Melioribacteraceae bacterium]
MSYESNMLAKLRMPSRSEVEKNLLIILVEHNGTIKEFGTGEEIVTKIADTFNLNTEQRKSYLETIYRKENRLKKSNLWHRLLFRAADNLAKRELITRPTKTYQLTNKKEWMLTEAGYNKALALLNIPKEQKNKLFIKSFEVEEVAKKIRVTEKPQKYIPFSSNSNKKQTTRLMNIRSRGFRQAIIEAYDFKCAICGLKIYSPNKYQWEVEAAHIIPHSKNGKDDIWNGLSLCRFHHWAFDVGWYGIDPELRIVTSRFVHNLPNDMGKQWNYDLINYPTNKNIKLFLPSDKSQWPDFLALQWHMENILQKG